MQLQALANALGSRDVQQDTASGSALQLYS